MVKKRVLVIEDEENARNVLKLLLNNFYEVYCTDNGEEGISKAIKMKPDLIILDILLPVLNGYETCKLLKENAFTRDIPILMISGIFKTSHDKSKGLDLGADDYVTKPFSNSELLSRIKVLIRRKHKSVSIRKYLKYDNLRIYTEERRLFIKRKKIILTKTEFDLLCLLIMNKNIALERKQIMKSIWSEDNSSEIRSVDNHIKNLRNKLGSKGNLIKSVSGIGYKIEC